jgi:hypothetical protein
MKWFAYKMADVLQINRHLAAITLDSNKSGLANSHNAITPQRQSNTFKPTVGVHCMRPAYIQQTSLYPILLNRIGGVLRFYFVNL